MVKVTPKLVIVKVSRGEIYQAVSSSEKST